MSKNYTFNSEATLIKRSFDHTKTDKHGNYISTDEEITLLCNVVNVKRNEFYVASNAGYKVHVNLIFNDFEYQGQNIIRFLGKEYEVIKTYPLPGGVVEVTIGEKIGGLK